PEILALTNGAPLLLGAEAEFFLNDGIATHANGVIDLDALTGPTLIGWVYGGLAADAPNRGATFASNAVFPVMISPVPEPAGLSRLAVVLAVAVISGRRVRRGDSGSGSCHSVAAGSRVARSIFSRLSFL
ncbi:MAG: hypothetical protein ACR2IT_11570, partial [Pirellulales bacterium]